MELRTFLEAAISQGRMFHLTLPDGAQDRIVPKDLYVKRGVLMLSYYSDLHKTSGEIEADALEVDTGAQSNDPTPTQETRPILSVSDLTHKVKQHVEAGPFRNLWVQGELTNVKYHGSGHVYFTLKDEETSIDVSLFRQNAMRLQFRLEAGLQVELYGKVEVYPKNTRLSFIAERANPAGQGPLQVAFEQMKRRLELEGLFDPSKKRPIPATPDTVGIITSATGAVIQDILRTTRVHFPRLHLILYPAAVQGDQAPQDIARALSLAQADNRAQVLIVCRGGGSAEDLLPFNSETVARAIAACTIPVISAVGHESDFTIADFAADYRCATPTAAAEKVSEGKKRLAETRRHLARRTANAMWGRMEEMRQRLRGVRPPRMAQLLGQMIREHQRTTDQCEDRAGDLIHHHLKDTRERFIRTAMRAYALSPAQVLGRGYSVVRHRAAAVTEAKSLHPGDEIEITFHKGKRKAVIHGEAF